MTQLDFVQETGLLPRFGNFHLGSSIKLSCWVVLVWDPSLGICCLGPLALDSSLGKLRLITSARDPSLNNFRLGYFAWELSLDNCHFGSSAWEIFLGTLDLLKFLGAFRGPSGEFVGDMWQKTFFP